jgi:hypothetical protein
MDTTANLVLKGTKKIPSRTGGGAGSYIFMVEPADAAAKGEACVWVKAS